MIRFIHVLCATTHVVAYAIAFAIARFREFEMCCVYALVAWASTLQLLCVVGEFWASRKPAAEATPPQVESR